jgi:serine phosphatase RsbU (regulator of sigma subunit)
MTGAGDGHFQKPRWPALAIFAAVLGASRQAAFWPALVAAYLVVRWLKSGYLVGVPWTLEGILAVGILVAFWTGALAGGFWGAWVGWVSARSADGVPVDRPRAARAGVWGLWIALALAAAPGSWRILALAAPAATLAGPILGTHVGLRIADRLLRRWRLFWDDGRWFANGLRFGPGRRWDCRGLIIGAGTGVLVAAVAFVGFFDALEGVALGARIRLRNQPWELATGTIDLSRRRAGAEAPELKIAILDLDDRTVAEFLERSSLFALNLRAMQRLARYRVERAVLPLSRLPDVEQQPGWVPAGLNALFPPPDQRYRRPPLNNSSIARLGADAGPLFDWLRKDDRALLALISQPRLEPAADANRRYVAMWSGLYQAFATRAPRRGMADIEPYLIEQLPALQMDTGMGPAPAPLLLAAASGGPSRAAAITEAARQAAPDRMLINVYGAAPGDFFPHVSYATLLAGSPIYNRRAGRWEPPEEFFRGRIVFLDSLYQPLYETPVGRYRATELLAMATDNLASRNFLRPPRAATVLLLLACIGALAGHLALSHRPVASAIRMVGGLVVLGIVACLLFVSNGIWVPLVGSGVAAFAGYVGVLQAATMADREDLEEQRRERAALEQSLAISRAIQASLLPSPDLDLGEFRVYCHFEPAHGVGGDFYNVFPLGDGRIALALGDVSGHGVRGAMYMTVATTLVESRADPGRRPSQVVADINVRLYPKIHRLRMFVSLFYGVLDLATGRLEWATAGQLPPIRIDREGNAAYLSGQGAPLGAMLVSQYRDAECLLEPGDSLLLTSDGLVEARDREGNLLGYPRFLAAVQQATAAGRELLADNLVRGIKESSDPTMEFDDLTVLVIHRPPVPVELVTGPAAQAAISG